MKFPSSRKRLSIILVSFLIAPIGCVSKTRLRKTLVENPDILSDVIQKNPDEFINAYKVAASAVRQKEAAEKAKEEKLRRYAEFADPKKPVVEKDRAIRGNISAPILIVCYSDFQCQYCKHGFQNIAEVRAKYEDKVCYVHKNFPLPFHPMAMPAALRFEAIALQSADKAYQFHDAIFIDQQRLAADGEKFLDEIAKGLGVDMKRMKKDLTSDVVKKRIADDTAEAKGFDFDGTPGFIVSGVRFFGAVAPAEFEDIIDRRLNELEPKK